MLRLANRKDLERICALLTNHVEITELLNEDSKKDPDAEAYMHYEVEINLKEIWG